MQSNVNKRGRFNEEEDSSDYYSSSDESDDEDEEALWRLSASFVTAASAMAVAAGFLVSEGTGRQSVTHVLSQSCCVGLLCQ
jgi:hypothetical protein